jgi:hypothetical protein
VDAYKFFKVKEMLITIVSIETGKVIDNLRVYRVARREGEQTNCDIRKICDKSELPFTFEALIVAIFMPYAFVSNGLGVAWNTELVALNEANALVSDFRRRKG